MVGERGGCGVVPLDGTERGRRREETDRAVLRDDPPERPGVGGADWLALVEHSGGAGEQRGVDDVGVPDDPPDVAGREHRLPRRHVVDVGHRPPQRDGISPAVAVDPLGLPRRAGGVEDVERVGGSHGDAAGRLRVAHDLRPRHLLPVGVALADLGRPLLTLQDDDGLRLVGAAVESLVEHRLVAHDPARLDPAGGRDDDLGLSVLDAGRELCRGEAAENDRVDGSEARAGKHRDDRLGHHRHVDDDAVALVDPEAGEGAGETRHLVEQLGVAQGAFGARDGRVVVQRGLLTPSCRDVPVEGVEADVELRVGKPPVEGRVGVVKDPPRRGHPVDALGSRPPEPLGVAQARVVDALVCRRGAVAHGLTVPLPSPTHQSHCVEVTDQTADRS